MTIKEQRVVVACDLCRDSSKPGYLWLGGNDFVECPQCFASKTIEVVERLHTPPKIFASVGVPSISIVRR